MRILLIGGGTGGHITPLLAVAHELKQLDPGISVAGVCEKSAKFADLYKDCPDIDEVFEIPAGKYRRYAGMSKLKKLTDVQTMALNTRDVFRTVKGYRQARKLIKSYKPDALLIKGGFVGVPMGLAAAKLKVPFITHDSDSTPGLANKIISKWAAVHATGMPAELYDYEPSKTSYTGIPISTNYQRVTPQDMQDYRQQLGMVDCDKVICVTGGSQGAGQLNEDVVAVSSRLLTKHNSLGILHIAGKANKQSTDELYHAELQPSELSRVVVTGFASDIYKYTGAADIVVTRASATVLAEAGTQQKPLILVPGQLAGAHQHKNAKFFEDKRAALMVEYADREGLYVAIDKLLGDTILMDELASNLAALARPNASRELANLTIKLAKQQ